MKYAAASSSILTVSQINFYIKSTLKDDYRLKNLLIKGEIVNLRIHPNGHIYFSLKDNSASFKAVMFESSAKNLKFKLQNGMDVVCQGYIDLYERDGSLQLYCNDVLPSGFGSRSLALAQLKQDLANQGFFDDKNKKEIPQLPRKIGVISGDESAALKDILNVLQKEYPICEVIIFPVPVQGENSDKYIAFATEFLDKNNLCDVIIVSRGGGSNEDLSSFNSEIVARYVFACKTPVISAVGHEVDTTLIDLVADFRAQTPTAAATIFATNLKNYISHMNFKKSKLIQLINTKILTQENKILIKKSNPIFQSYNNIIEKALNINNIKREKLYNIINNKFDLSAEFSNNSKDKLQNIINNRINMLEDNISSNNNQLENYIQTKIMDLTSLTKNRIDRLNDLSPLNIIKRGYCVAYLSKDGKSMSIEEIEKEDTFNLITNTKEISAKAIEIKQK